MDIIERAQQFLYFLGMEVELDKTWSYHLPGENVDRTFRFRIDDQGKLAWECWLHEDLGDSGGRDAWLDVTEQFNSDELLEILMNPDKLMRMRHWTMEDIEDASAAKRLFGEVTVERYLNGRHVYLHQNNCRFELAQNRFPSVEAGESVPLSAIVEVR